MTRAEGGRPPGDAPSRLLVVGAGLIGTSLALAAAAAGYAVSLDDRDPPRLDLATSLGALQRWTSGDEVDIAVVAIPPGSIAAVAGDLIRRAVAPVVSHVGSVQLQPQREIEAMGLDVAGYVGSHPIAGRERSGPHHATADLFDQRPWIVCPAPATAPAAIAAMRRLAAACGGQVSEMSAASHDRLFARLSHVPQLVASALAAPLGDLDRAQAALAGGGLRDTTRIADSEPQLWADVVAANPAEVAAGLREVLGPLQQVLDALDAAEPADARAAVDHLLRRGAAGRARLAGKHGQQAVRWATVAVVVPDEPGRLARLLADAAGAEVNVEDIRVDHAPGQPLGLVELDVAPGRVEVLGRALAARGWSITASPPLA